MRFCLSVEVYKIEVSEWVFQSVNNVFIEKWKHKFNLAWDPPNQTEMWIRTWNNLGWFKSCYWFLYFICSWKSSGSIPVSEKMEICNKWESFNLKCKLVSDLYVSSLNCICLNSESKLSIQHLSNKAWLFVLFRRAKKSHRHIS